MSYLIFQSYVFPCRASAPNASGEPLPEAGAQRTLEAVGFGVEPVVAQPAPPQSRT
jgi:hypothetical protein